MADDYIVPYVIPLSSQKPKYLSLLPSDAGSRYKTRQLQVQIVGKSKMMKTMLVNILDIAKDMQVPPSYVGTFMGYEIGAQAKWDPKKPERQQAFLSGEHDTKDLSKIALQFIHEVILCPGCHLPEIVTEVDDGKVNGRCRACGGLNELKITNEKFKRYILNHPPATKGGSFSGSKNIKEKDIAVKKQVAKQNERERAEKVGEVEESVPKKRSKEDDENIVWYSDTSDEAARARREKMLPDAVAKVINKKIPEVAEVGAVLQSPDKLLELRNSCGITDAEFIPVLFLAIVPKDAQNLSSIVSNKGIIRKFIGDRDSQIALLRSIEKFYGETQPSLVSKIAPFVKELYDEELLDEENVLIWFDNQNGAIQKVRDSIAPLIKWFKETEESGSEDED